MKENQTDEQWRRIEGYPCYYVSDQGRVMSLRNPKNPKILKQGKDRKGYRQVILTSGDGYGNGEKKAFRVHRLVAQAFIPNPHPEKRRDVGHWDSCPWSNFKENLYWCTPAENNANPITVQRRADARPEAVKKTSKAVYVYDEELNQVSAFTSTASAARVLDVSQGNIASCATGALPRFLGRIWSYMELTDMKQREELENKKAYQRRKNMNSTLQAVLKHYRKEKEKNSEKYQKLLARANEYSKKYYWTHTEEIKAKAKQKRREKRIQNTSGQTQVF